MRDSEALLGGAKAMPPQFAVRFCRAGAPTSRQDPRLAGGVELMIVLDTPCIAVWETTCMLLVGESLTAADKLVRPRTRDHVSARATVSLTRPRLRVFHSLIPRLDPAGRRLARAHSPRDHQRLSHLPVVLGDADCRRAGRGRLPLALQTRRQDADRSDRRLLGSSRRRPRSGPAAI